MSRTIAANGTNGKIFYSSFCPHCLQLAVAEEDADDSMHTQLHSLWYQRNAWWFLWPIFCLSCWRTRYANAGQIVIKLDLKKPTWVVLLFKNFHSALCECFNYGFYQHPGALFWGLAALQWFVCRVPWAGGLSLSAPLGQAGGHWGFLREFYCLTLVSCSCLWGTCPVWHQGASLNRPACGAWELEMPADTARMSMSQWMGKLSVKYQDMVKKGWRIISLP